MILSPQCESQWGPMLFGHQQNIFLVCQNKKSIQIWNDLYVLFVLKFKEEKRFIRLLLRRLITFPKRYTWLKNLLDLKDSPLLPFGSYTPDWQCFIKLLTLARELKTHSKLAGRTLCRLRNYVHINTQLLWRKRVCRRLESKVCGDICWSFLTV